MSTSNRARGDLEPDDWCFLALFLANDGRTPLISWMKILGVTFIGCTWQ
jgi:hypothetical protein